MLSRLARLLPLLLVLLVPPAAMAQTMPPPAAERAAEPASVEDLDRLIGSLEDPAARERLLRDLRALRAAQQQLEPEPAAPPAGQLGARLMQTMSGGLAEIGMLVEDLAASMGRPDRLMAWLRFQVQAPERRAMWAQVGLKLVLVLGAGAAAAFLSNILISAARRRLEREVGPGLLYRVPLLLARAILDLVPVAAFAAAALAAVELLEPVDRVRLVMLAAVNAAITVGIVLTAARAVLSPYAPALRLFRLENDTAAYLYVWSRRLAHIAIYGYFLLQAGSLLGLPDGAYRLGSKSLGLLITALLVLLVMQNREPVAAWIRGVGELGREPQSLRVARRRLAEVWHILAVFYLVGTFAVWLLEVDGGFAYLVRGTLLTLLIVLLARLVVMVSRQLLDRLLRINHELLRRYPLIERRADRYLPHLRGTLLVVIQVVALMAILAAWQVDVGAVLQSDFVRAVLSRLATIAIVLAVAVAIWEVVSGLITVYLDRRDEQGQVLVRSARLRTLLPLIRNALLVVILVLAALTMLSELGVDIAPLLAGAGVVGLAIGFGAQTLVKDVITGAFILFEDTVNVGDVADINGIGGFVEAITIRTIRLRDLSGTVHTIPFGAINSVSNLTKEFSFYLLDVRVDYRENTDRVLSAMHEVFDDIRADPVLGPDIIDAFEVLGVDRFEESAVYVRARIKTKPIRQWAIGREYNRRMKLKFDELGITMPFPHRTIHMSGEAVRRSIDVPPAQGGEAG